MKAIPAFLFSVSLVFLVACGGGSTASNSLSSNNGSATSSTGTIKNVNHVLVMMQENRSFDEYFGYMTQYRQKNNIPINSSDGKIRDLSDPAAQVAGSKNISPATGQAILPYHTGSVCTEDLTPDWAESHHEMDLNNPASAGPNSPMDGFAATAKGLGDFLGVLMDTTGRRAMGIFDDSQLNFYYATASNFAMSDAFYSPAPTRTSSNRLFIHAATSHGTVHADTSVTAQLPSKTIWRALDEQNITWKIYLSDAPQWNMTFFDFFSDSNDPNRQKNIVPISNYFNDVQNGTLPSVAFIETGMHTGRDEHPTNNPNPGVAVPQDQAIDVQAGAAWSAQIINALMGSPSWKDTVFFWFFDEGGGAFDHVPPISVPNPDGIKPTDFDVAKDCFGQDCGSFDFNITGFRVPNFIVSPFAKKNFVSHTPMDYTAVLKFIETRFGLQSLNQRDASMPDMTEFFDFSNGGPWATPPTPVQQRRDGVCDFSQE